MENEQPPVNQTPPIPPPPATPPPPPAEPPAAPPATTIVVTGTKTEREIELETRLATEEARAKKAETDASYHADEARRLREAQTAPTPAPKVKRARFTLLHRED